MRIITLVIYVLIGLFIAWFASNNFGRVSMWLPGGYEANWPLAVYMIAALLLGALPLSLMHSISRWRWERRIRKLEAELAARETPDLSRAARETPAMSREAGPRLETATPPLSPQ
ncbi:lipopolysaccharide assembly protein LapA domain-containing protein [Pacificimonas sp. ICDLI1SI03]